MRWPFRIVRAAERESGASAARADSSASQALNATLLTRGFATEDFELEEEPSSDLSQLLGVSAGILKVRCGSTGEERTYSTGSGSAWLGAFLMDLGKGHFAHALRRGGAHAIPMSLPAPQPSGA